MRFSAWFSKAAAFYDEAVRPSEPAEFDELRRDFNAVNEIVLRQGETDDVEEIEARTDAAFATLVEQKAVLFAISRLNFG